MVVVCIVDTGTSLLSALSQCGVMSFMPSLEQQTQKRKEVYFKEEFGQVVTLCQPCASSLGGSESKYMSCYPTLSFVVLCLHPQCLFVMQRKAAEIFCSGAYA